MLDVLPGILVQGPDRVFYLPIEKKIEQIPVPGAFIVSHGCTVLRRRSARLLYTAFRQLVPFLRNGINSTSNDPVGRSDAASFQSSPSGNQSKRPRQPSPRHLDLVSKVRRLPPNPTSPEKGGRNDLTPLLISSPSPTASRTGPSTGHIMLGAPKRQRIAEHRVEQFSATGLNTSTAPLGNGHRHGLAPPRWAKACDRDVMAISVARPYPPAARSCGD